MTNRPQPSDEAMKKLYMLLAKNHAKVAENILKRSAGEEKGA